MEQNVAQLGLFEQLWAWYEANKKQALAGAGIVVIVGGVASFYLWYQGEKESSAAEALSNASVPLMISGGNKSEAADAYLKVAVEYPGSSAASRAVLQAAGVLFTQGRYADAQTQFERFIRENPGSPFRAEAQLGVATCFDAQGKTDAAAQAYKDLVDRHPSETVVPQAKFALARIYESQNKFTEAYNLYLQVAQSDAAGSIGSEAGMRAEELKSKLPPSAPAPMISPAAKMLPAPSTRKTTGAP